MKISTHKIFHNRHRTVNPEAVVMKRKQLTGQPVFITEALRGTFYRVFPQTPREILALQLLEHRTEKHAPAHGDGVLLTPEALAKFA